MCSVLQFLPIPHPQPRHAIYWQKLAKAILQTHLPVCLRVLVNTNHNNNRSKWIAFNLTAFYYSQFLSLLPHFPWAVPHFMAGCLLLVQVAPLSAVKSTTTFRWQLSEFSLYHRHSWVCTTIAFLCVSKCFLDMLSIAQKYIFWLGFRLMRG